MHLADKEHSGGKIFGKGGPVGWQKPHTALTGPPLPHAMPKAAVHRLFTFRHPHNSDCSGVANGSPGLLQTVPGSNLVGSGIARDFQGVVAGKALQQQRRLWSNVPVMPVRMLITLKLTCRAAQSLSLRPSHPSVLGDCPGATKAWQGVLKRQLTEKLLIRLKSRVNCCV